jgi:hypothetical protein
MVCLVFVGVMRGPGEIGGWKLWSRFDSMRFFGRQTVGAGWNRTAGAFGKLQKEANGGLVTDEDMEESGRREVCEKQEVDRELRSEKGLGG